MISVRGFASFWTLALAAFGLVFSTACDNKAPAPPFLDQLPATTTAMEIVVEGTAEPDSVVTLTRDPALEAALEAVTADPYNGRFRFTVPLAAGTENTLSVVATDQSKKANASQAATATITQVQAYPAVVRLDLAPAVVSADDGKVAVAIEVIPADRGMSMAGQVVDVTVQNYAGTVASLTLTADAGGFAQGLLEGFSVMGSGEIVATAATAGPDGTAASALRVLRVMPGLPSVADILLSADVGGTPVGPAADITVPAGTVVDAAVEVRDAQGNVLPAPAVQLSTDAPGVLVVAGTRLVGLTRAGAWSVFLQAGGITVTGEAKVTVEPNPAAGVILVVSDNRVVGGERILVQVLDAYGNPVDPAEVALDIDGTPIDQHPDATYANSELTFSRAGLYTIGVVFNADPTVSDSVQVLVEDLVDTRPPEATIDAILFPTSSLVAPRGRIEVQITFSDDRALANALLYAQFGDVPACSASSGTLLLNGQTLVTTAASVRVPRCAAPFDTVSFVVEVWDQAGNIGFSAIDNSLSIAAPPGFDITANTAYSATIAGWGDRIKTGDNPTDLAVEPGTDVIYLTLENNNEVILVFPDRTQDRLRDLARNTINFNRPEGLALDASGNLLVGDPGAGGNGWIDLIDPVLTVTRGQIDTNRRPGRMTIDELGAVPLLCVAYPVANIVECWTDFAGPTPSSMLMLDGPVDGLLNPVAVALDAGTLWILEADCTVKQATLTYDAITPSVTASAVTTVAPVGPAAVGAICRDIAALPSGDVAVVDSDLGQVFRMSPAGDTSVVAEGLADPMGIDFANGALYLLDRQMRAVFKISGNF